MTSYATLRDNANSREDIVGSNSATPSTPPSEGELLASAARMKQLVTPLTPDSFSESEREKMDSTPENIKKIDDVINEADHQQHHQALAAPAMGGGLSPRSERYTASFNSIGLAAAVDDSNAKICRAKPPPKGNTKNVNMQIKATLKALLYFFYYFLTFTE